MSIEAMKQALEALENMHIVELAIEDLQSWNKAVKSLRQAIAEAEKHEVSQEPVVWMYQNKSTHEVLFQKHMRAFVDHSKTYETPLYTHPQPKRELVGLTEDEIALLCGECAASAHNWNDISFARAIEAKLKEKNT